MDEIGEDVTPQNKAQPAGATQSALVVPQREECAAGPTAPEERFSLLAELAKDPANGLEEIRPGLYITVAATPDW